MRTRIKICGITRRVDAMAAVSYGVDALGFVFYPRSRRVIAIKTAAEIIKELPPFVSKVALFVDPTPAEVIEVITQMPIDLLQFHGEESPHFCDSFKIPYIKAIRMRPGIDLMQMSRIYFNAQGILVDTYQPGVPGGTGETFNWDEVVGERDFPLILAGGLTAENVTAAINQTYPYAVDVSGGVESAPGIKDASRLLAFIIATQKANT